MKWLLVLLLLPQTVFSQGLSSNEKEFVFPSFRECGLVTRWSSSIIPPNCLTEARNVYFDEDLSVYRRRGQAQYNATPCTDSKAIKGMWKFNATDGQRYVVLFSSQTMFWTKNNGDCTAISGLSNLNEDAEVECVQTLGKLWCTNGINTPFWTTVTSTGTFGNDLTDPSAPATLYGTKIGSYKNRLIMTGISGQLTRIRLSGDGNGEDWALKIPGQSTSPASIDIAGTNDGKKVTALLGSYQNAFYIGREDELYGLYGNDRRDFTLRQISSEIGVLDSRSVQEKNNCLTWLSRRGQERMCGTTIERASDEIRDQIDVIIGATGNTRTKTYDTQTNWETGLYSAQIAQQGPTSTSIYPGSVVPSTWGHITTEGAHWAAGTLTNTSTAYNNEGSISLDINISSGIFDAFTDGNYTANPDWVFGGSNNSFSVSGGELLYGGNTSESGYLSVVSTTTSFGNWVSNQSVTWVSSSWYREQTFHFVSNTGIPSTSNGYALFFGGINGTSTTSPVHLGRIDGGVFVTLSSTTVLSSRVASECGGGFCYRSTCEFNISRNDSNLIKVTGACLGSFNMEAVDSTYSFIENSIILQESRTSGSTVYPLEDKWDNIYVPKGYYSTGTWISPSFDTTFSTPIGGPYYFSEDVPVGSTVTYQVRESTSSTLQTWSDWVNISTTTSGEFRIPLTKRYWQEKVSLSTDYSTQTPVIEMTSLEATTSGYYIADCVDATRVTSWGNFRPDSRLTGASAITYAVSSGTTCNQVTRSTVTWTAQLANAPITISTSNFLGIRVFVLPYTTTDTLRLDALTQEWNEGSERPPVASEVYRDRYYLFYTTNTDSGSYNDHALVLDSNNKWSILDGINAYSAVVYENQLMTGDSQDTGKMFIQDGVGVFSDNGSDYGFEIKTSDYDFGSPLEKKVLKRVYLILKSEETPGQDIDLTLKYHINGSTASHSLLSADLSEAVEKGYFIAKFPAINEQQSTFNWLKLGLSYDGSEGPINLYGIRVVYALLRNE